jgi:hypothetical protein
MAELLDAASNNIIILVFLIICIATTSIIVLVLSVVGFLQGREISLWPPKIGEKLPGKDKSPQLSDNERFAVSDDEEHKIVGLWGDWLIGFKEPRVSLVNIILKNNIYTIEGNEYDEKGHSTGRWKSDVSKFRKDKRRLEYLFEASLQKSDGKMQVVNGYSVIEFFGATDEPPNTYAGSFIDIIDPETGELRKGQFEGIRFADNYDIQNYKSPEGRKILIDKLIAYASKRSKDT